jgi:hypothetical protein
MRGGLLPTNQFPAANGSGLALKSSSILIALVEAETSTLLAALFASMTFTEPPMPELDLNGLDVHNLTDIKVSHEGREYVFVPQGTWPTPIPVEERLPEVDAEVLVYDASHGEWFPAMFKCEMYEDKPDFWIYGMSDEDSDSYYETTRKTVTHWLPKPPAPE